MKKSEIVKIYKKKLEEIQEIHETDIESGHYFEDELLCELLNLLGYTEITKIFHSTKKEVLKIMTKEDIFKKYWLIFTVTQGNQEEFYKYLDRMITELRINGFGSFETMSEMNDLVTEFAAFKSQLELDI